MVKKILELVRSCWNGNGVSIISDGWNDTANRPLVNIIVMSPSGSYFLRAIDASGEEKNVDLIARKNAEAIELVGPSNVVQVIKDNARSCKAAGQLLRDCMKMSFGHPVLCIV